MRNRRSFFGMELNTMPGYKKGYEFGAEPSPAMMQRILAFMLTLSASEMQEMEALDPSRPGGDAGAIVIKNFFESPTAAGGYAARNYVNSSNLSLPLKSKFVAFIDANTPRPSGVKIDKLSSKQPNMIGAGGGALAGFFVGGPIGAAIGGIAGWFLGDAYK